MLIELGDLHYNHINKPVTHIVAVTDNMRHVNVLGKFALRVKTTLTFGDASGKSRCVAVSRDAS